MRPARRKGRLTCAFFLNFLVSQLLMWTDVIPLCQFFRQTALYGTARRYWLLSQEKISCNLVLKLKAFVSDYLQESTTRCITRAAPFFKNVPGTFFNTRHQVKAIAIAVSEADPPVYIGDCSSPLNLHVFVTLFTAK